MAAGPLRFRTSLIEELPTVQSKQAPGFAWVTVSGPSQDPLTDWGATNRKRARISLGGQSEQQRENLTAKQQKEIERKIRILNDDNSSRDIAIPQPRREGGGSGATRAGKTSNTKKILASGKEFKHYLDDEEAEIARTGKRDGDLEVAVLVQQPTKTPITRRRPREVSSVSASPAPLSTGFPRSGKSHVNMLPSASDEMDLDDNMDSEDDATSSLPSPSDIEALLNAPSLTYDQARSAPPPPDRPPPRKFCDSCGYWGRFKCMKCGTMVCSVICKDVHDQANCLKIYV